MPETESLFLAGRERKASGERVDLGARAGTEGLEGCREVDR